MKNATKFIYDNIILFFFQLFGSMVWLYIILIICGIQIPAFFDVLTQQIFVLICVKTFIFAFAKHPAVEKKVTHKTEVTAEDSVLWNDSEFTENEK